MLGVTIKTLATALNLSTATVSKALSDSYDISEETKLRVRKLAEELNYVPDLYASSLRKRKSHTIALVIPEVADSFFSQAINGIEAVAREKGYHVLCCHITAVKIIGSYFCRVHLFTNTVEENNRNIFICKFLYMCCCYCFSSY